MKKKLCIIMLAGLLIMQCFAGNVILAAEGEKQDYLTAEGTVLPQAVPENCFYILPIFETSSKLNEEELVAEIDRINNQIGKSKLYMKTGFSAIYATQGVLERNARIAYAKDVKLGVIFSWQTHSMGKAFDKEINSDLRVLQWRLDGATWKGYSEKDSGGIEIATNRRDWLIPSPSRYNAAIQKRYHAYADEWSKYVKNIMDKYPGVITCINAIIEEELAVMARAGDAYLADYSPFAITEFRDWLRHTGKYAIGAEFGGQGALETQIGEYMTIEGQKRSQFYDDPTPDNANNTGVSFNSYFGTNFKTWDLKSWDLSKYAEPIAYDEKFDPTPDSGNGFIEGGFDAPRERNDSKFWRAWSWDYQDAGNKYPEGNPKNPAFGFRQVMVHNFIIDIFDTFIKNGLPTELMYPHQIPGEFVGDVRNRSGATPIWTGYLPKSGNLGITRFGPLNPDLITQYTDSWGIFEWHPKPRAEADSKEFYDTTVADLNLYFNNKCHILYPGWWKSTKDIKGEYESIYKFDDSNFAVGIKDFMSVRKDVPYWLGDGDETKYTPPVVQGVTLSATNDGTVMVKFSPKIWDQADLYDCWNDWTQFNNFEIAYSSDKSKWESVDTKYYQYTLKDISVDGSPLYVKVRAKTKASKVGEWSNIVELDSQQAKIDSENIAVVVNGKQLAFEDAKPFVEDGRTLIPLRKVMESLKAVVEWKEADQTVSIKDENTAILCKVGQATASVNGKNIEMSVPCKMVGDRTFVPLRFISESLGHDVKWDENAQTVDILVKVPTTVNIPKKVVAPPAKAVKVDAAARKASNINVTDIKGEKINISAIEGSLQQEDNPPKNAVDGNVVTRWSAEGAGDVFLKLDLGTEKKVSSASIRYFDGNLRVSYFDIEVSTDGTNWSKVFVGKSSGKTNDAEGYSFDEISARYIKIVGFGNSISGWNSICELVIYGK